MVNEAKQSFGKPLGTATKSRVAAPRAIDRAAECESNLLWEQVLSCQMLSAVSAIAVSGDVEMEVIAVIAV